jgi:PAS domain S-box-containing protein
MGKLIRVLMVEDSEIDAELVLRQLRKNGYEPEHDRVEAAVAMRTALREKTWDVILCDYQMPQFTGLAAIALLKETGIDIPLIIVSGAIGEETAVEAMKAGAHDYVMKGNLARLVPAIVRELEEAESRRKRKQAEEELQKSELDYRLLFENSLMGISEALPDGRLIRANMAYANMYGYASPDEMIIEIKDIGHKLYANPEDRKEVLRILGEKGFMEPREVPVIRRDGSRFYVLASAREIRDATGKLVSYQATHIDITERKNTETSLKESEERFRLAAESTSDLIYERDLITGIATFFGDMDAFQGYEPGGFPHSLEGFIEHLHPDDVIKTGEAFQLANEQNRSYDVIHRLRRKDGSYVTWWDRATIIKDDRGFPFKVVGAATDITKLKKAQDEREQAEDALRKSEEKYRNILESIEEAYYEVDLTGNFVFFNDSMCRLLGYPKEDLMGMNNRQYTDTENSKKLFQAFNEVYRTEKSFNAFDWQIKRKDGTNRYIEASVALRKDSASKAIGFRGIVRDITDRRQTEKALIESEERYRALFDRSLDGIFINDLEGNFIDANKAALDMIGYEREDILSLNYASLLIDDQLPQVLKELQNVLETGHQKSLLESRLRRKDGSYLYVESMGAVIYRDGKPYAIQGLARDVTERKRADKELKESEKKYRELYEFLPISVVEIDTRGIITSVNPTCYEVFRYKHDDIVEGKAAMEFFKPTELERLGINMQRVLSGTSIPGQEFIFLRKDGSTFSGLIFATKIIKSNDLVGIRAAIIDITERKQAEDERQKSFARTRSALVATVHAMALLVETRDPYTAGHQRRVADLACAIAVEMGLPSDQIDGVSMAATIHDIGKISIPAEILSKPTKLTDLQFNIIKTHSQSGYDILKDIEFPWPIARMVLEHHERMNGSGYPEGLKGDQTLLESRIISVSDVVEAMASHRPYRPGLGIEAAMDEIAKNKGVFYDADVVDACLRLFHNKGYKIVE